MKEKKEKKSRVVKLAQTALMAALCFAAFFWLQIRIPLPGGEATSLHIGNAFCVLAALLLGGLNGGLAGAIGMSIADLLIPEYVTSAPQTFVLKLCMGLITGLVAHRIAKVGKSTDKRYIFKWSIIASVAGFAFNVIFAPLVGYFYKQYILGHPQQLASILARYGAIATFVNAVVSAILVVIVYNSVRPILLRLGFISVEE